MPCDSKTISGDDVIMLHSNCCARVLLLPGSNDCITARYALQVVEHIHQPNRHGQ